MMMFEEGFIVLKGLIKKLVHHIVFKLLEGEYHAILIVLYQSQQSPPCSKVSSLYWVYKSKALGNHVPLESIVVRIVLPPGTVVGHTIVNISAMSYCTC